MNADNDRMHGTSNAGQDADFDKDQPSENAGAPLHQGGRAIGTGRTVRNMPKKNSGATRSRDEPNVDDLDR